ncbi:MAG: response regulator [Pseudomonadota bacterium]
MKNYQNMQNSRNSHLDGGRHSRPSVDESDSSAMRVLLVEDSRIISEVIKENLAGIPGLELAGVAETESDALDLLNANSYDVLILDIQLKQGNGINLLRTLAARPIESKAVKIVFSNHVSKTYRRICEQYGVQYFFDKTAEFSQLHTLLTRLSVGAQAH